MGRGDGTKHGITIEDVFLSDEKVSVGAFREFVTRTSYRTDCEKLGGGWVVTNKKQWAQKLDACWDNPYMLQEEHDPVVLVSWYDAATFANWKSQREGLSTAYTITRTEDHWTVEWDRKADGYRLPTEAEWEHAARAGLMDTPSGMAASRQKADRADSSAMSPGQWSKSGSGAFEWCWEFCDNDLPDGRSQPSHPAFVAPRLCRGVVAGESNNSEVPGGRACCDPLTRSIVIGFRLVRNAKRGRIARLIQSTILSSGL